MVGIAYQAFKVALLNKVVAFQETFIVDNFGFLIQQQGSNNPFVGIVELQKRVIRTHCTETERDVARQKAHKVPDISGDTVDNRAQERAITTGLFVNESGMTT